MNPLALVQNKIKNITQVVFVNSHVKEVHASILECLHNQHLPMVFQPIVNHTTQDIFAHESLSRPTYRGATIRPDVWFGVAHDYHHSLETDLLAIRNAIQQSSIGARSSEGQLLFINVMPSSLTSRSFHVELESIFRSGVCQPSQIILEIIEHVTYDPAALHDALHPLRDIGIRFALDDVGLGASNLSSIVELEPDLIKLDRALIAGISSSISKQKMVSQLVDYMGSGDRVIAEGIENMDDLDIVKQTGVHLSQGFIWGKPEPFHLVPTKQHLFGAQSVTVPVLKSELQNGTVQVHHGQIIVNNPKRIGNFATIEIPSDPRVNVIVNSTPSIGRILVQENDNIFVESHNVEPTSRLLTRESPDKMEVIVVRQITPGEQYQLADKEESAHIVLEIKSEAVYPGQLATESIIEVLQSCGYQGTLDESAIEQLCNARETTEVTVLRGKRPIAGTPNSYTEIEQPREYDPLHRRMKTSTVSVGMKVATLTRGTPGVHGYNVFGERLEPPLLGASPTVGPGVVEIGDMLVALRNGRLVFTKNKIDVVPELVIGHNLTSKDGNVDFDGDVIVYGSILDGAYIQSSGTVTVHGSVMCATVMGERGVFVSGSIVGSQVIAGQSKFLYQKTEPTLRRCITEYQRFRQEYKTLLQHAQNHPDKAANIPMIAYVLLEQRHPMLLSIFEQLSNDFRDLSSRDAVFAQLTHELRSKWLVIQRTKIHEQDVEFLHEQLVNFLDRVQTIASAEPADIRVNTVTSSILRATGKIVVKGSGVSTSTLESEDTILIKGSVRGGFMIAKHTVRVYELGTKSATETAVKVVDNTGLISIKIRHSNTVLQVGKQRDRNFEPQNNVLYRRLAYDR
ncbi:EAL domain-containing protein (plasmid) [Alicyclobacillus curvatus]|nr:EAL domain-containing protein [Alicyclobacillus curvatus]